MNIVSMITDGQNEILFREREVILIIISFSFLIKAKGDSMINARIHDGDVVFIRKQDIVENGEIAAVVINHDSEATLKRFYYYQERATPFALSHV